MFTASPSVWRSVVGSPGLFCYASVSFTASLSSITEPLNLNSQLPTLYTIPPFSVLSLACYVTSPLRGHLPWHRTTIIRTNHMTHVTHMTGSRAPITLDCLANFYRSFKVQLNSSGTVFSSPPRQNRVPALWLHAFGHPSHLTLSPQVEDLFYQRSD